MIVAQESLAHVDEVWFILSPHNPQKKAGSLLGENERFSLLLQAMSDAKNAKFKASDIEFSLPKPSYTVNTIRELKKQHPEEHFSLIAGTDTFFCNSNWRDRDEILKDLPFIVIERGEYTFQKRDIDTIIPGFTSISATAVREKIKNGDPLGYLVPGGVEDIIKDKGFYV